MQRLTTMARASATPFTQQLRATTMLAVSPCLHSVGQNSMHSMCAIQFFLCSAHVSIWPKQYTTRRGDHRPVTTRPNPIYNDRRRTGYGYGSPLWHLQEYPCRSLLILYPGCISPSSFMFSYDETRSPASDEEYHLPISERSNLPSLELRSNLSFLRLG
jgi:hypothetical protein